MVDLLGGNRYVTFLRSWEGGTSSKQTDYAKKCHTGIHTVKGITFCTFQYLAPNLNYNDFVSMDDVLWNNLYNKYYTNSSWSIDLLKELKDKYPLVAFNILESAWMRGAVRAESDWSKYLRKWRNYGEENITPNMILYSFINETTNYNSLLKMMYYNRRQIYLDIGGANVKGWMNRLNSLYYYFAPKEVNESLGILKSSRKVEGL